MCECFWLCLLGPDIYAQYLNEGTRDQHQLSCLCVCEFNGYMPICLLFRWTDFGDLILQFIGEINTVTRVGDGRMTKIDFTLLWHDINLKAQAVIWEDWIPFWYVSETWVSCRHFPECASEKSDWYIQLELYYIWKMLIMCIRLHSV